MSGTPTLDRERLSFFPQSHARRAKRKRYASFLVLAFYHVSKEKYETARSLHQHACRGIVFTHCAFCAVLLPSSLGVFATYVNVNNGLPRRRFKGFVTRSSSRIASHAGLFRGGMKNELP